MKKQRTIIVKHPVLRNLRNNLRQVFYTAVLLEPQRLCELINKKIKEIDLNSRSDERMMKDLAIQSSRIAGLLQNSICKCRYCSMGLNSDEIGTPDPNCMKKDMVYIPNGRYPGKWECVECYEIHQINLKRMKEDGQVFIP